MAKITIDHSNKQLNDEDLNKILFNLPKCKISLNLSNNLISDKGVEIIFHYLEKDETIKSLNLNNNKITLAGFKIIMNSLKIHKTNLDIIRLVGSMDYSKKFDLPLDIEIYISKFKRPDMTHGSGDYSKNSSHNSFFRLKKSKFLSSKHNDKKMIVFQKYRDYRLLLHLYILEKILII